MKAMELRPPSPPERPAWRSLFEAIDPSRDVAVRIHRSPDPDALGAGTGLAALIEAHVGHPVPVLYQGELERVDTESLVGRLGLPVREAAPQLDPPQLVFVDCQPLSGNVGRPHGTAVGVVDHHRWNERFHAPFADLRPQYGASATIVAEYLREAGVTPSPRVAAAMLYGIRTDTRFICTGTSSADIEAFAWLHSRADRDALAWVERNTVRLAELPCFHQALGGLVRVDDLAFVRLHDLDRFTYVPHVADLLLAVAEIAFVAAWTVMDGKFRVSVRSEMEGVDSPEVLAEVLGPDASLGGHLMAAAGSLAIARLADRLGVPVTDEARFDEQLRARFLRALGRA